MYQICPAEYLFQYRYKNKSQGSISLKKGGCLFVEYCVLLKNKVQAELSKQVHCHGECATCCTWGYPKIRGI